MRADAVALVLIGDDGDPVRGVGPDDLRDLIEHAVLAGTAALKRAQAPTGRECLDAAHEQHAAFGSRFTYQRDAEAIGVEGRIEARDPAAAVLGLRWAVLKLDPAKVEELGRPR